MVSITVWIFSKTSFSKQFIDENVIAKESIEVKVPYTLQSHVK